MSTIEQPKRPSIILQTECIFEPAEWSTEEAPAFACVIRGYELSYEVKEGREFPWIIRATSEISESPEVFETGVARSVGGAEIALREAANRAERARYRDAKEAHEKAQAKRTQRRPKAAKAA